MGNGLLFATPGRIFSAWGAFAAELPRLNVDPTAI
jgi:hypothetical protein